MTVRRTFRFALLLIVSLSFGRVSVGAAADGPDGKTPIHRDVREPAATADLQSTGSGGTTLVFLGVLLAGAVLVRRYVQQRVRRREGASADTVTLLGRQQIDSELTVRLVQVGPRVLVVGSSPQGLTTLAELTDPEEIALLTGETAPANGLFGGESALSDAKLATGSMLQARRPSRIPASTPTGG